MYTRKFNTYLDLHFRDFRSESLHVGASLVIETLLRLQLRLKPSHLLSSVSLQIWGKVTNYYYYSTFVNRE